MQKMPLRIWRQISTHGDVKIKALNKLDTIKKEMIYLLQNTETSEIEGMSNCPFIIDNENFLIGKQILIIPEWMTDFFPAYGK